MFGFIVILMVKRLLKKSACLYDQQKKATERCITKMF